MLEYIYICRHGFRTSWTNSGQQRGPTGVPRDFPLAAKGLEQSNELAAFLSSADALAPHAVPERVVTSPFYRCAQTAVPTARALGTRLHVDHGIMEWYVPAEEGTGLHPRPCAGGPADLVPWVPDGIVEPAYTSTLWPSRRGEGMRALHDRADLFVEAFTARMEAEGVRSVVLFSHAATVIALGRALTGDKDCEVHAGCACTSLYRRKKPAVEGGPCGVGEWEMVWNGKADYMLHGLERDWSAPIYRGEVLPEEGDLEEHSAADELPVGLTPGMEKHLRRGRPTPNTYIKELNTGPFVKPRL